MRISDLKPVIFLDYLINILLQTTQILNQASNGPIAQLAEPPAHNRSVPGSIPGGPTFFLVKNRMQFNGGAACGAAISAIWILESGVGFDGPALF